LPGHTPCAILGQPSGYGVVSVFVVGTAGHVDHGKSTLVEALTGIDPDRLVVEKERGMTIDLGFAWLQLPSGNEVSIVDVPGHERFVNNMLAGVGGIDLALLVVAADESVMPQTREHLAILDLLHVSRGLVAVTKRDLVDDDWVDLVTSEVEDLLEGTALEGAPVVPVSAATRDGLDDLVSTMDVLLTETPVKHDLGRPRLPIDRSFTIAGFGTVVTGTLIDGDLSVGQDAELVLSGEETRVRGLQTHRKKLEIAEPGTRVAANLAGVSHEEIIRGEVLTTPGWLRQTTAVDVHLRVLSDAPNPLKHNMFVTVHTGSSEVIGRLRLLETDKAEPGAATWAQLKLEAPLAAAKGDYFVIRSNQTTLGGGNIVETHAKRHRRRHAPILDRLSLMEEGSDHEILLATIAFSEPAEFDAIVNRANLQPGEARSELSDMAEEKLVVVVGDRALGSGTLIYTGAGWTDVTVRTRAFLDGYHGQFPMRKGAPKEELRSRLKMTPQLFNDVVPKLVKDDVLAEEGTLVRSAEHEPELSEDDRRASEDYIGQLEASPYSPPTDATIDPELLNLLADQGKVVKVSDSVVFATSAYREMAERISAHIEERGEITVADVRDMFSTSRKYALALMDYLDQQRITRRVGDARVLR